MIKKIQLNTLKRLIILPTILSSLVACSDVNDNILTLQEKAYQSGRACLNNDTLNSCREFVGDFEKMSNLFVKHAAEIRKKAAEGDTDSDQIIFNAQKLSNMALAIRN